MPSKFAELVPLHPSVRWIVRIHSELPFLANEGIAVEWIKEYLAYPQVSVAANSATAVRDLRQHVSAPKRVLYLPNYYRESSSPGSAQCST